MFKNISEKFKPKVRTRIIDGGPTILLDAFGEVIGVMQNDALIPFSRGYVDDHEQAREIEDAYDHFPTELGEDGHTYLVGE